MDYLTFTKKLDRVTDIGIVSKPENVVVGQAGFLLSSKVFVYISNSVTGTLEDFRRKWYTRGGYRINACSVVNKIGVKTTVFYLLEGEVTGQLVNDGPQKLGAKVYLPELKFCGDNGAMIAAQGYYQYMAGHTAGLDLNGLPTLPIDYE